MPDTPPPSLRTDVALPHTFGAALLRGARGQCPRCGEAALFRKWLKPVDHCRACALDMTGQRADDFPAYIAIFVTGHLLAPVLIMMMGDWNLSASMTIAIIIPLAVAMLLALLQPSKGAVIAIQWWNGMHGFRKERVPEAEPEDTAA
ncbi:DUF983 domain-containing protein [Qipengyuania flava]|uniref:DUF983 domain-containing protein n=1 Tax=Qipengyuania flava TaxID=192812 RepID=UPI001C629FB5|nr:DUF983 domain-containing protein [Qipengyuania flava]QYJ06954.1 DUF983 domain-containing protein [Qipengyuania flava]